MEHVYVDICFGRTYFSYFSYYFPVSIKTTILDKFLFWNRQFVLIVTAPLDSFQTYITHSSSKLGHVKAVKQRFSISGEKVDSPKTLSESDWWLKNIYGTISWTSKISIIDCHWTAFTKALTFPFIFARATPANIEKQFVTLYIVFH